ncbi:MAG: TIGR01440 family protein [Clostridiales bacterium]|nr:TIGR01440 family protein [Clostridiales bacterium]
MLDEIKKQTAACLLELLDAARVDGGDILVIGCSTSEIAGKSIGAFSKAPEDDAAFSREAAEAVFAAVYPILRDRGIYLAAQCCEHLNRALVLSKEAAERYGLPLVSAVPVREAGGSWAAWAYQHMHEPVVVEDLGSRKAAAGLDIGETCIGMHLRPVAVMVRPTHLWIGEARITMARTRPKLIGGERAKYV